MKYLKKKILSKNKLLSNFKIKVITFDNDGNVETNKTIISSAQIIKK